MPLPAKTSRMIPSTLGAIRIASATSAFGPPPIAQWESEIGGRYWYSVGRTEKDLFGFPGGPPIFLSRLTYTNLQAHSGEAFGRVEHLSGFFIKGFVGGGAITGGNLQDEDFPPFPYSSTNSDQRDGRLAYATVDLGWTWRSEGIKLGFFGGYFYNFERVNTFGCNQTPQIRSFACRRSQFGLRDYARHHLECGARRIQWGVEIWWRLARGSGFGMGSLGLAQCKRHALAAPVQRPGRGHQFFQCANRGIARLPVYQWHFSGCRRTILEN